VSAIADSVYLDQLHELETRLLEATRDLEEALILHDAELATACARRLLAIGLRFGDVARTQP
jgi:hypothetical protein